jgi:hypothetical protein
MKLKANVEKRTVDPPKFQKHDVVHYNMEHEGSAIFWLVEKNVKNSSVKLVPFKAIANYQYVTDRAENPVYEYQDKLGLVNVTFSASSQGFEIGVAEYRRVLHIVSSGDDSDGAENEERSFDALISPTKVFTAQLNAKKGNDGVLVAKQNVTTTEQFGLSFEKIASRDLDPKHFIGVYIYWLTSFGYFHPSYIRDQAKSGERSFLIPYILQRLIPLFASGPFDEVADQQKKDLLQIYSSTIDSACYRVLKYDINSGAHFRDVLGVGKTKIGPAFQQISSFSGIVRFANGGTATKNTAYLFVPPIFPSDLVRSTYPLKKK